MRLSTFLHLPSFLLPGMLLLGTIWTFPPTLHLAMVPAPAAAPGAAP